MSGGIFLIKDDGELVKMEESDYESEEILQTQLVDYPDLLAGDQIDPVSPRKWILIAQEMGVPGEAGGSDRWSLDHLFLDQDAIPTLVEVKRKGDTRIRREVVGQMMDYAANAVVYWTPGSLRGNFLETCEKHGKNPDEEMASLIGPEADIEAFWARADAQLKSGRTRLLFVADKIPPELARIIEFLNGQMNPAEVLGVEVRPYAGEGLKTLVPRVIGQTEVARNAKGGGSAGQPRNWDRGSLSASVEASGNDVFARRFAELMAVADRSGNELVIDFGKGRQNGSVILRNSAGTSFFVIFDHGVVNLPCQSGDAFKRLSTVVERFADRLAWRNCLEGKWASLEKKVLCDISEDEHVALCEFLKELIDAMCSK